MSMSVILSMCEQDPSKLSIMNELPGMTVQAYVSQGQDLRGSLWQIQEIWTNKIAYLTHWVTHVCVGKLTNIGSDNGLLPGWHQAITWTNVGILLIGPLGTNFSEMFIEIHTFSFKKIHLKMSSGKCRPFCLGLNVLRAVYVCKC